jgi:hypothetical protein
VQHMHHPVLLESCRRATATSRTDRRADDVTLRRA